MEENKIGKRIKEVRESKKMTQKKLSSVTGIDVTSISRYENDSQFPNLDTIIKISRGLECSLDYLVFGDGDSVYIERKNQSEEEMIFSSLSDLFEKKILEINEGYDSAELYVSIESDLYWDFCKKINKLKDFYGYIGGEYNKAKDIMVKKYAEDLKLEKKVIELQNELPF